MDASPRCIELIHGSEGFYTKLPDGRYKAYLDKLAKPPVPTIYCGLTKGVTMDTVWTVEQCEKAFTKEMSFYEDAIERMVSVKLNQNQFDALVSLVYNIGPGSPTDTKEKRGFYWSTLRKLLNQGKYEEAAMQFKRYKYAGGVVLNGLVTRRAKEAALFMEPMPDDHQEEHQPLPQVVDAGPVVSTGTAIATSPTVAMTAVGLPGALYAWWQHISEFFFGVVNEAGPQLVQTQQSLSPFSALFKMTPPLILTLTIGTILAVAVRQIMKRRNGTSV
jgi:lysozyme